MLHRSPQATAWLTNITMLPLLLLLTTALVPLPLTSALSFEFGRPPTSPGFRGVTTGGGVDLNSITLYHAYFGEVIVNPDSGAEVDTEEFSTFVQRLFAGLDMNRDGRVSQAEMDEGLRVGRTDGSIPEEWDVKISSLIAPLVADGVGGATVDTDDNRVISEPELATFLRDRFQNITLAQIADLRPHKPLLGIPFLKGWHDRWAHSTCPDGDAQFSWRRVQACIRGQGTCSIFTCGQMVPTMVYDANSTVSLFERMGRGLRRVFGRRDRTEEAKEEHETSAALSSSSGAQDANLIVPTVDMKSGDTTGIPTSTGNGTAAPIINVGGPSDGSQPTPIAPSPSTGGSSPSTGEPSMDSGTASGGGTDPAQDAALQRRRRQKALIISWDILMLSMNTLALGFALSTITATMSIVSLPFTVISLIVWTISLIIDVQRPVTRRSIGTAPQGA